MLAQLPVDIVVGKMLIMGTLFHVRRGKEGGEERRRGGREEEREGGGEGGRRGEREEGREGGGEGGRRRGREGGGEREGVCLLYMYITFVQVIEPVLTVAAALSVQSPFNRVPLGHNDISVSQLITMSVHFS